MDGKSGAKDEKRRHRMKEPGGIRDKKLSHLFLRPCVLSKKLFTALHKQQKYISNMIKNFPKRCRCCSWHGGLIVSKK